MAKLAHTIERTEERTATAGDPSEPRGAVELSTDQLADTEFDTEVELQDLTLNTTDWLALLTTGPMPSGDVEAEAEEERALPETQPSGMIEHATPPRMRPTIGSRLTTGVRRGTLLLSLAGLAVGALAAGAYMVSSTTWFSTLLTPSSPISSQPPNIDASTNGGEQTIAEPLPSGASAIDLRDRGVKEYRAGNYTASIELLESALSLDGGDALSYYQLGLSYMAVDGREHALEDAEMAFRTASSLQPNWAAPYQLLAESLVRRSFYQEAIDPATEATRLDPTQSEAWMTLGRAYRGTGKQTEARDAFAEAARQAPALPANQP